MRPSAANESTRRGGSKRVDPPTPLVKAVQLLALLTVSCSPDTGTPEQGQGSPPLLPAEVLRSQRAKDVDVLRALADAGADLSKPHSLEHHFICPDREAAQRVIAWAVDAGYSPGEVLDGEWEGRKYAYFDLIKHTVPTIENVSSQTGAMLEVAAKYGVEYDGWGCAVVK